MRALQNDAPTLALLDNGAKSIGCGTVTVNTPYPYILVSHDGTVYHRGMGLCEQYTESKMTVTVFAEDEAGSPGQAVVNDLMKAVATCIGTEGNVTIAGREVETPVLIETGPSMSQVVDQNHIIRWSEQTWILNTSSTV